MHYNENYIPSKTEGKGYIRAAVCGLLLGILTALFI